MISILYGFYKSYHCTFCCYSTAKKQNKRCQQRYKIRHKSANKKKKILIFVNKKSIYCKTKTLTIDNT